MIKIDNKKVKSVERMFYLSVGGFLLNSILFTWLFQVDRGSAWLPVLAMGAFLVASVCNYLQLPEDKR